MNFFEPFKIKMVEPIYLTTAEEREKLLQDAKYNVYRIPSNKVTIDLLTDSGVGAMSDKQWSKLFCGDESFAGTANYNTLRDTVYDIMGFKYVLPVPQGRAAEKIFSTLITNKEKVAVSNTFFTTTASNLKKAHIRAVDLPIAEAFDADSDFRFKGNIDLDKLQDFINSTGADSISACVITVTNNTLNGQPVSLSNIRGARRILEKYNIPLFIDAARFAENIYFIKMYEEEFKDTPIKQIARELFSYTDGVLFSAKKNGLANIGGLLAVRDKDLFQRAQEISLIFEGYYEHGGLAGRDLEIVAQGLREILDENYLSYRIKMVDYLAKGLQSKNVPIYKPPAAHAVYIDARKFLTHIPPEHLPAQVLICYLYLDGGIRASHLHYTCRDKNNHLFEIDSVRLAIPHRVYTISHLDYVIDVFETIGKNKERFKGLKLIYPNKPVSEINPFCEFELI